MNIKTVAVYSILSILASGVMATTNHVVKLNEEAKRVVQKG